MDFIKQNIPSIAFAVIVLAGIFVYTTYFGNQSSATLTSSDSESAISQNLLATLQSLHTIQLDDSIFSEPAFQSLTDFGVTIQHVDAGRRNPFAPLDATTLFTTGGSAVPAGTAAAAVGATKTGN